MCDDETGVSDNLWKLMFTKELVLFDMSMQFFTEVAVVGIRVLSPLARNLLKKNQNNFV